MNVLKNQSDVAVRRQGKSGPWSEIFEKAVKRSRVGVLTQENSPEQGILYRSYWVT